MLDNWLKKWYSKSYQDASVENPSTEVWDNIASKLDDETSFWYTSNVASKENSEPVSPRVWENLNAYVDARAAQIVQKRWRFVRNFGLTTILLVVPFFISDSFENVTNVHPTHSAQAAIPSHGTSVASPETENRTEIKLSPSEESTVAYAQNQQETSTYNSSLATSEDFSVLPENVPSANKIATVLTAQTSAPALVYDEVAELPVRTITAEDEFDTEMDRTLVMSRNEIATTPTEISRPSSTGKWRLGIGVNNQVSNLLNPITQQGIDKDSDIDLSISSNYSFDISLERKVGRFGYLGLSARLNDQKTQRYHDLYGSEQIEKQLSLSYQSLFLNYSQAILTKHFNKRFGLELNSGIYVAHLGDVTEKWDNQDRYELTEGFRTFDLGAMIGINGSYRISKSFDVNAGVYYSNGAINVFKGVETMPSYFFRTFTSSYGGSVKLRYYFDR